MACLPAASTAEPERCKPSVPPEAQHPITARAHSLAGDYELIQVQTQPTAGVARSGSLHLVSLDSAARAGAAGGAARDLIGWLTVTQGDSARRPDAGSRDPNRPGVVLTGDHLRLGQAGDVDAYVEHLTITAVGPSGFWGWWKADPGWDVAARRGVRTLPDPAGYFCAHRVRS
jgi:hypothetical protein